MHVARSPSTDYLWSIPLSHLEGDDKVTRMAKVRSPPAPPSSCFGVLEKTQRLRIALYSQATSRQSFSSQMRTHPRKPAVAKYHNCSFKIAPPLAWVMMCLVSIENTCFLTNEGYRAEIAEYGITKFCPSNLIPDAAPADAWSRL